uniref:Uncharacterized protein n=1 Tax=Candidatus Nitrotoga fabula TaxID=2182327 RepID=A0A2X0QW18_9PROT|nr:membrane protein of unknown function [Candidatus Nitrotoga fabula]
MIPGGDKYIWLVWALAFLIPWGLLYAVFPEQRRVMVLSSLLTAMFGLTEPIFVPEYWNPPSLFELAQRTGFDIESLIFCFGLGGIGVVLYNALTGKRLMPMSNHEHSNPRHRFHRVALGMPFVVFVALYFLPWNPIYPGITALLAGGLSGVLCRPDLAKKTLIGGALFAGFFPVLSNRVGNNGSRLYRAGVESSGAQRRDGRRFSNRRAIVWLWHRGVLVRGI